MPADDDAEEDVLTKNNSSVIIRIELKLSKVTKARYLIGGDAEVAIWDRIWERNEKWPERLEYDVLIAPHHCFSGIGIWSCEAGIVSGEIAPVFSNDRSCCGVYANSA